MMPLPHGGNLIAAQRHYPLAPRPFVDLSTGINPHAYPFADPPALSWHRLPEPEEIAALEIAAARAYGVHGPDMVVAAPGTQALIQLLPRLFPQPSVMIPGPTYGEHAATWTAAGAAVVDASRALILCNPNNPDGARHDPAQLAAHTHDLLVVDEAFADFEPALSLAPLLPLPRTIVLRSFGKTYGLAGLRLGFALAEPMIASRIRAALGPWAISGPAIAIGTQALDDTAWRDAAAAATRAASVQLDAQLTGAGLRVIGGTSLFRLAETETAAGLADHLGKAGILVRTFVGQATWLRFGLPGSPTAWSRFSQALLDWTGQTVTLPPT